MKPPALPRVLLVEDDPVSRAFLAEAASAVARVQAQGSAAAALEVARRAPGFDLWLLDAHLPDSDGADLLRALRVHAPYTPALAHTADPDPAVAGRLRMAGFLEVLVKPIAGAALRTAIVRACAGELAVAEVAAPPWDESRALAMVRGTRAHADRLRALFVAELPQQHAQLHAAIASGEVHAALLVLHRLRASCALVGAGALEVAVRALQAAPSSVSVLRAFDAAVAGVLRAQDAAEVRQQVP